MKDSSGSSAVMFFTKNRYLLLVLLVGVVLLLLPGDGTAQQGQSATEEEQRLLGALRSMEGVGEAYVLLAQENSRGGGFTGAVILCQGANNAEVRLQVVEAVSAFTGLGSNRIMVLKMKS